MKKLKLIIILLIILTIVILVSLLFVNKKEESEITDSETPENLEVEIEEEVAEVLLERSDYFTVDACIREYLNILNINNSVYYGYNEDEEYVCLVSESEKKENIYNLLSSKYIKDNNITINNLYKNIDPLEEKVLFSILDMKNMQNPKLKTYAVHFIIEDMIDYTLIDEQYVIVNIDEKNLTFSIEPLEEEYNSIEEIELEYLEETITKKENNVFTYPTMTNEDVVREYLSLYKKITLSSPKIMYNLLDEDYRDKRFGSLAEYKEYVEQNKQEIKTAMVDKYQIAQQNEYTQYIIIDKNGNYYIFNEKEVMDYSVILDTYTIDTPQFIEKYNSANAQGRMALNLQKFFDAIKNNDYNYAYNCLSEGFKNNNFGSLESFEAYIKGICYSDLEIEYEEFEEKSGLYTYKIRITNLDESNPSTIEKTFIMKLNEGTNFELSFNV